MCLMMHGLKSQRRSDEGSAVGQHPAKTSALSGIVTQQDRAAGLRAFIRRGESDSAVTRDLTAAPLFSRAQAFPHQEQIPSRATLVNRQGRAGVIEFCGHDYQMSGQRVTDD
jgi:hypothetical protein